MARRYPEIEARKRASAAQLLFKSARLVNERAIARVRQETGAPLRVAHTMLLPHLDFEGVRLTDLAERLGVTKQAVAQLVDELEDMGMLERLPDPSDGRAKLVRFSARGRAGILQGLGVLGEIERELERAVGRDRFRELHKTLTKLCDYLEPECG